MSDEPVVWVGGNHQFRLGLGELRALQKNCDAGPEQVFNRLRMGTWRVDDIIEPIRLGLIGANEMKQSEAGPFVTSLMDKHPILEFKLTALEILASALLPLEGQTVEGKPEPAEPEQKSGTSPESTEAAQ